MTRPTGKTNPASIFTRPGLEAINEGEPPARTWASRPPKDKRTPATNCEMWVRIYFVGTGGTHGFEKDDIGASAVL